MRTTGVRESIFADDSYARSLGFRGIVVPGPMLTAYLEQFVRQHTSGWRLERLSTTFRIPTIAGCALCLHGAVTEHHEMADGEHLVCDLVIEHVGGERAVTGTARLFRGRA